MIVTRPNFDEVLGLLAREPKLSIDTETTGLRPHHGSRLFSLIIGTKSQGAFYFNFQSYPDLPPEQLLLPSHLKVKLRVLFKDPLKLWFIHNAKFDMAMLARENLFLAGPVHCTKALARVEFNEHQNYDLGSCAERIGVKKDDAVEKYITDHHLWEWETIPGKKQRVKNKHFDRVPFEIIQPYGETDANVGYRVGESQETSFSLVAANQTLLPEQVRLKNIVDTERALTKVIFRMEERGVLVDIPYTKRAQAYEWDQAEKALQWFKRETGKAFSASPKLFQEVFASEKDLWVWGERTKTGQINPSFEGDTLAKFKNPAAKAILEYRGAKSRHDFYAGFLYHADDSGVIHPQFNPDGARTGRFSSSNPNLQNLTSEEGEEEKEFIVRRAIIPRPGFLFLMPDYDQQEYRMMLDLAREDALIDLILGGLDVHIATAQMMGITRKQAKAINFGLLYGQGQAALADALGVSVVEGRRLKALYFSKLPCVEAFIEDVIAAVETRGFLRNWAGRRCYFPNKDFAYTGPNTLIQGGCADVIKKSLVDIDAYLSEKKSKLVLTIHDENPIECHEDEIDEVPQRVKEIMERVYPAKRLPLTVGMEYSRKSLGDKTKGFPVSDRGAVASA